MNITHTPQKFINFYENTPKIRDSDNMPICEICGMEVVKVHECSECEAKYCDECGDLKRKLCYDCVGWEDDDKDEEWDDIRDFDVGWDDDAPHRHNN